MQLSKACDETVTGEARVRIEGGLAHFPGRVNEKVVSFAELDPPQREELTSLADQADFFDCKASTDSVRPDARTYTIRLTIDHRSRELRVAEPIRDPALAKLVSAMRRLTAKQATAR
jgi:hypothetical protein